LGAPSGFSLTLSARRARRTRSAAHRSSRIATASTPDEALSCPRIRANEGSRGEEWDACGTAEPELTAPGTVDYGRVVIDGRDCARVGSGLPSRLVLPDSIE